jgi:glycosyltransferase involved in cell wall biosynthesis
MESLFMPVFQAISVKDPQYEFHVLQFSWADEGKIKSIADKARSSGIIYTHHVIRRKPLASIWSMVTVIQGIKIVKKYIRKHQIAIVMPRSTMPAMMVNYIKRLNVKILFDADGLPLEERIDFFGLKKGSFQYTFLKRIETQLLKKADAVITRSNKAIDIHVNTLGETNRSKFYKVTNGINTNTFVLDERSRNEWRETLAIKSGEKVFVYCGSLGEQYCWEEMYAIFTQYLNFDSNCRFLVLTGSPSFLNRKIDNCIENKLIIKTVSAHEIPLYLNIADIALAIRKPSYSMQGVAPIKLGEYLLMGLPTIASKGIGDTEELLQSLPGCFLYDHNDSNRIDHAIQWINSEKTDQIKLSQLAKNKFSLEKSADDYLKALRSFDI